MCRLALQLHVERTTVLPTQLVANHSQSIKHSAATVVRNLLCDTISAVCFALFVYAQHIQQGVCQRGRSADTVQGGWTAHQCPARALQAPAGTQAAQHSRADCLQASVCKVQPHHLGQDWRHNQRPSPLQLRVLARAHCTPQVREC